MQVSWRLFLPAALHAEAVLEKVEALRKYSKGLPFERVMPRVRHLHGKKLEAERSRSRTRWILADLSVPATNDPRGEYDSIEATEVVSFVIWLGRGAETGWFGVARYPDTDPRVREETGGNWFGHGLCKTLYAAHPRSGGLPHFMKCHLGLVAVLDEARRLGFEARVSDDGGYWEHRQVKMLIERLHQAEHLVAGIVGRLTGILAAGQEGVVMTAMMGRPDFEPVEAGARRPAVPPMDDVVMDLIRRTRGTLDLETGL